MYGEENIIWDYLEIFLEGKENRRSRQAVPDVSRRPYTVLWQELQFLWQTWKIRYFLRE